MLRQSSTMSSLNTNLKPFLPKFTICDFIVLFIVYIVSHCSVLLLIDWLVDRWLWLADDFDWQVSECREALASQRLAARLLALRTQQLENKLSQLSENNVTPTDITSVHVQDKLSRVSDNCVTPADDGDDAETLSWLSFDFHLNYQSESPQSGFWPGDAVRVFLLRQTPTPALSVTSGQK